jgi:sulfate transport system ATP-binding protein
MSFVGETVRLGEEWVRPHDLALSVDPVESGVEALVERVVHLGFEVRVELALGEGERLVAQLTPDESELLEVLPGQILYVRARKSTISGDPTRPVTA